jgi:hypothetical protein
MTRKEQEYSEKGKHYYRSLLHCINQLIIIEGLERKDKYDLSVLKQMKAAYPHIKKESK